MDEKKNPDSDLLSWKIKQFQSRSLLRTNKQTHRNNKYAQRYMTYVRMLIGKCIPIRLGNSQRALCGGSNILWWWLRVWLTVSCSNSRNIEQVWLFPEAVFSFQFEWVSEWFFVNGIGFISPIVRHPNDTFKNWKYRFFSESPIAYIIIRHTVHVYIASRFFFLLQLVYINSFPGLNSYIHSLCVVSVL